MSSRAAVCESNSSSWAGNVASSLCTPLASTISVTTGFPAVSVPVLSKATMSICAVRSRCEPPLIKIPRRAAPPIAESTVAGVLMTSAHGEATTITVMAL